MSKALKIVLIIVLVAAVIAGGGYLCWVLTSPQYALSGMVKEVNERGISAVESHLTGSALTAWQKVADVIQNPLVGAVMSLSPAQSALSIISRGAGSLKTEYQYVKRGWNNSSVTLHVEAPVGSGNIDLQMARKGFSWLIEDVAVPVGSWTIK